MRVKKDERRVERERERDQSELSEQLATASKSSTKF